MNKRILLIDDEPDFTELAGTLLSFHDFTVDTFNDAAKIDEIVAKNRYDLIVTDLMMPDVDGFQLITKVRALPQYATTSIIVLSAKTLSDEERKFLLQQKVNFLPKPFEPQELVEKITQLLSGS